MIDIKRRTLKKGFYVHTPRFCTVEIREVFDSKDKAYEAGFTESTNYENIGYDVFGKDLGCNRMHFAAIKK